MEISNKCPYCQNEMETGYVQSPKILIWGKKKHKLSFWPNEASGDILIEGEGLLDRYKPAYRCPHCDIILMTRVTGSS